MMAYLPQPAIQRYALPPIMNKLRCHLHIPPSPKTVHKEQTVIWAKKCVAADNADMECGLVPLNVNAGMTSANSIVLLRASSCILWNWVIVDQHYKFIGGSTLCL